MVGLVLGKIALSQSEEVFKVKKSGGEGKEYQKVYKLNILEGVDTLEINSGGMYDFTAAKGNYDSISVFNLTYQLYGSRIFIRTGKFAGVGMLKLFKKDADGGMHLFFIKNIQLVRPKSYDE